ncbi:MAG: hypothetical protein WBF35_08350 [Candidatus Acidiferrales bacterium]
MRDLVALCFVGLVIYEAVTGKVFGTAGGQIKRAEHPLLYWISLVGGICFAVVCLYGVLHEFYYWMVSQ